MLDQVLKFEGYEIEETVGFGSGGTLYRAFLPTENAGAGRRDLLYRAFPDIARDVNAVDSIRARLSLSAGLAHANLFSPIRCILSKDDLVIASDWVPCARLSSLDTGMSESNARWTIPAALYLSSEIAKALCQVQSRAGLVHGQVNPDNIFITFDGNVKLLSLGMAAAEEALLQLCRGHRDGLPNFASPEQAAGLEIDSRSDFFSLGVLLWGMLANRPLYPASSREDWVKKLSEETPPSASQANPEAPNELDQILAKLLDRDMHMRYELGDRAVRDFEAVLSKYYPDFSAQDFAAFCDNHTLHFKKKYQAFLNARNEPQESTKALDFPTREESTFPSVEAPTATNLKEVSAPVPAPTIPNEAEEQEPIVLENAFEASYSPQGKFRVNVSMAPVEGPRPKIVDSNPLLSSTWLKVVLVCCMLTLLVIPFEGSNVLRHARSNRARSAASAPHGSLHILSKVQDYDLEINGKAFYVEDGSVNVPANIDLEVTAKKDGYEDFETITQVMPGEDLDLPIEFRKLISANAATPPAKVPPPPASSRINVGSKR